MVFNYFCYVVVNFRLGEEEGGSLWSSFFFVVVFEGNVRNIVMGYEGYCFCLKIFSRW